MTYETYTWMSYICGGLSLVMLIISIFLFFKLKIVDVIGDLTGLKAKRAIKGINEQNTLTASNQNKMAKVRSERTKITEKITKSGNLEKKNTDRGFQVETEKLNMHDKRKNMVANETTILEKNQRSTIGGVQNETTILNVNKLQGHSAGFNIEYEITYTHATERIS